ncbi:MAG TPA: DUF2178 domain-containing protein [Tepidisphaeraceae bacterium]|jgi:hypothetical protein|nr:DUF2178 domain-containing protein [Tepidisphaeraceae bacterium]
MTATQKQHTFNLIVIAITFALFFAAAPFIGVTHAGGFLGLMGFLGFGIFFLWKRGQSTQVIADERDRAIQQRAFHVAFAIFWAIFVLACVGAWLIYGDNGAIPIRFLPVIMYCSWGLWQATQSIAVLIQYRTA